MYKIWGAIIGFFLLGRNVIGAVIGFAIGAVIDNFAASGGKKGNSNNEDMFEYYRQHAGGTKTDFATMLMALSAAVMRATVKF